MQGKKKQFSSLEPTMSTGRETLSEISIKPKILSYEKYGLQQQVKEFFSSRPKTQQRSANTGKKTTTPKISEPQILPRDYQYDNRGVFDLHNKGERGRNTGLQTILSKMHLAPRSCNSPFLSQDNSSTMRINVDDSYRLGSKKGSKNFKNFSSETPGFGKK